MKNLDSKNIILSVLGIAILFVAIIGISYAIFMYTSSSEVENTLSTGTISMKYTESNTDIISIQNAVPLRDEVGKNQTDYFDFVVSSNISGNATISYEVRAIKIDVTPAVPIADNDIRLYLEKKNGELYEGVMEPTSFNLNSNTKLTNVNVDPSMLLYSGTISNESSNSKSDTSNFRLRMWLSDSAYIDNTERTFKIKVNIYASVLK